MGYLQNALLPPPPKPNPNSLFLGPAPAQALLPHPAAALGALGAALLGQKQHQQASQAGSALAHKSHPQTLPQAPAPPAGLAGAGQALQTQLTAYQQQQQQAQDALKAAMAAPSPDAPQYQQAEMAPQNPGLALGAALSALFAPKVSQGAIGALGVDQTNREEAYKREDAANKDQYKAQSDTFNALTDKRQKGIDNAEKLDVLADRNVNTTNTLIGTNDYRQEQAKEAQAREAETIHNHALLEHNREFKRKEWMVDSSRKDKALNHLIDYQASELGLRHEQVQAVRDRLALGYDQLSSLNTRFGVSQNNVMKINGIRNGLSMIQMLNRNNQSDAKIVAGTLRDINNAVTTLNAHNNPTAAAAAAKKLQDMQSSPFIQGLLKKYGTSGDAIADEYDAFSQVDSAETAPAPTDGSTPAPTASAAPVTINVGTSPPGGSSSAPDIYAQAQALMGKVDAGTGSFQSVDAQGHAHNQTHATNNAPLTHNQPFQPDQGKEAQIKTAYEQWVKHFNGDKAKAWHAIAPSLPKAVGIQPQEVELYRRSVMGSGASQHSGNGHPTR